MDTQTKTQILELMSQAHADGIEDAFKVMIKSFRQVEEQTPMIPVSAVLEILNSSRAALKDHMKIEVSEHSQTH